MQANAPEDVRKRFNSLLHVVMGLNIGHQRICRAMIDLTPKVQQTEVLAALNALWKDLDAIESEWEVHFS